MSPTAPAATETKAIAPVPSSNLTIEQVLTAEENISLMELALQDIRRLMEEKEMLKASVEELKKEKEELMGKGQTLRRSSAVARKSLVVARMDGRRTSLVKQQE